MDKKVITEHYLINHPRLIKRFQQRVPNKSLALAEEVVQEAYARALKYFSTYDNKINTFDIWFNKILRNALNDCRQIEKDKGITYQLNENFEELSVTKEEKSQYLYILQYIYTIDNNRDKIIISLFYINGYTSKDISIYLGISDNHVRQIILRHRNKIKERSEIY